MSTGALFFLPSGLRRPGMWLAIALATVPCSLSACGNTPTLPLPPPVVSMIGPPNAQGLVDIEGQADPHALVTVFDQQTENGTIAPAQDNGHFEISIEASAGDVLVIWQDADNLEGQRTEQTVPATSR